MCFLNARIDMPACVRQKNFLRFSAVGWLALVCCLSLSSQTINGRFLGTITDQTGAALKGAMVTVTDVQRGTSRTVATDDDGGYVVPNLSPSTYKIRAEAKGFKTLERANVGLEVAQDIRIDLTLQTEAFRKPS